MSDKSEPAGLFSVEFLSLCLIFMASFCNVSVFYSFFHYLGAIGIPPAWAGFLVGLEPMAAFAFRLAVIPWIHARNAFAVMTISLFLLIAVSCSYLWAGNIASLAVLRVFHGAVFVLLTSTVVALMVVFIPVEKSGQGFSTISIATMIPYAVMPMLVESALPYVRNESEIYAGVAVFSAVSLLLSALVYRRTTAALSGKDQVLMRRPRFSEIRANFRRQPVAILLSTSLLVYFAHAAVFYFIKDLTLESSGGEVGSFFTVSMLMMIAVRAAGGAMFDRLDKARLLQASLSLLVVCLVLLPVSGSGASFYAIACLYGACMGVAFPLLNALLFSASAPAMRGLNTNMSLFTMDAAYFLVPYAGGFLIAAGAGFSRLFQAGAVFIALAALLIFRLRGKAPTTPRESGSERIPRPPRSAAAEGKRANHV